MTFIFFLPVDRDNGTALSLTLSDDRDNGTALSLTEVVCRTSIFDKLLVVALSGLSLLFKFENPIKDADISLDSAIPDLKRHSCAISLPSSVSIYLHLLTKDAWFITKSKDQENKLIEHARIHTCIATKAQYDCVYKMMVPVIWLQSSAFTHLQS